MSETTLLSRVEIGSGKLPLVSNAVPTADKSSPIYFLHIPKTAGTAFHRFVVSQFPTPNEA